MVVELAVGKTTVVELGLGRTTVVELGLGRTTVVVGPPEGGETVGTGPGFAPQPVKLKIRAATAVAALSRVVDVVGVLHGRRDLPTPDLPIVRFHRDATDSAFRRRRAQRSSRCLAPAARGRRGFSVVLPHKAAAESAILRSCDRLYAQGRS
jgi:hypothetical protein